MTECFCPVDQDGHCASCKSEVVDHCKKIVSILTEYCSQMETILSAFQARLGDMERHPSCGGCTERYADLGVSELVPALKDSTEFVARTIVEGLRQAFAKKGITATPLTLKAWSEICARNGWVV